MLMASVLSCYVSRRSGRTEVKSPEDSVTQKDYPREEKRQDPNPRHPCPTDSTAPLAHDQAHSRRGRGRQERFAPMLMCAVVMLVNYCVS